MLRLFSWVFEQRGLSFASKLEYMQFYLPVTMGTSASQGFDSPAGEFADADLLAMFSGLDNPIGMADWLNLPSLSGNASNWRYARTADVLYFHISLNQCVA